MRRIAISNEEMHQQYGWAPPAHQERHKQRPTNPTYPEGWPGRHPTPLPKEGLDYDHPAYREGNNPDVWGSLAGHHNPFHYHDLEEPSPPAGFTEHEGWMYDSDHDNEGLAEQVRAHLQKTVDAGHPCIMVPHHVLHQVIAEGRVKSQFETGTSRGARNEDLRGQSEYTNFGYPHHNARDGHFDPWTIGIDDDDDHGGGQEEDHPRHARPVYGYLAHDPIKNTTASQYGEHTLVLHKPHVWHRTTVTFDDSLGEEHTMRPSPAQRVHINSAHPEGIEHMSRFTGYHTPYDYTDSPATILHHQLKHHLEHHLDTGDYTEAQYHGGVHLGNVHYAILRTQHGHAGTDVEPLKKALNARGIPWVHTKFAQVQEHSGMNKEALYRRVLHYQASLVAAREGSMDVKVVATRGAGIYLLQNADGTGQIADTQKGILYPPRNILAIEARGYWTDVDDVDAADVLALVRPA